MNESHPTSSEQKVDSWLWQRGRYVVIRLGADPLEIGRVLDQMEELDDLDLIRWTVIGQPRAGLTIFRRNRWWTRLWRRASTLGAW